MNIQKKHHPGATGAIVHVPENINIGKYVVIGIIILVLFLAGFSLLSSSNNSGNSSTPAIVPLTPIENPLGENTSSASDLGENPESVYSCPDGQILNEEVGECEPKDKLPEEVGPVGEPQGGAIYSDAGVPDVGESGYGHIPGFLKYGNSLYPYEEQNNNINAYREWNDTFGFVNGHPLYLRVNSIEKEKVLDFSIGYINDNNKWNEVKRFISEKERIEVNDKGYVSYGGCFSYPNDPLYPNDKACTYTPKSSYGFTVVENTPHGFGITGTICFYQGTLSSEDKNEIYTFRSGISFDPGPSISSLSD